MAASFVALISAFYFWRGGGGHKTRGWGTQPPRYIAQQAIMLLAELGKISHSQMTLPVSKANDCHQGAQHTKIKLIIDPFTGVGHSIAQRNKKKAQPLY